MWPLFRPFRAIGIVILASAAPSCGRRGAPDYVAPAGASWLSVLGEVTDIATMARPVATWERSLHFSSSAAAGKVPLANLAPEIMGDMDHGFFLDVVEHSDGVDATLADIEGRGMISWIWSANPAGTIRLFIDDDSVPVLETSFLDFMKGAFLEVPYPFAATTANGYNLHFPILHANHCKIVVRAPRKRDLATLYYQIAWNAAEPGQAVNRFEMADISRVQARLREIGKRLQQAQESPGVATLEAIPIAARQTVTLFLSNTEGTIASVFLRTERKADLAALRLMAYWDDLPRPALDCPLSLLAGTTERMENASTLGASVRSSTILLRWPMPFKTARLAVGNASAREVRLEYGVQVAPHSGPMRFVGQYTAHPDLRTEDPNVLTLGDLSGSGRVAACNILVKSRTNRWWGEGDQLIYLDSPDAPTWRGTGTEDYFGLAWCSTAAFDHFLRGQSVIEMKSQRTTAMRRCHLLDRLPFHCFARFRTEAWGLSEGSMDYESLVLYYIDALRAPAMEMGEGLR